MNNQAIDYAYKLFQGDGYTKSLDEFKNLLQTNDKAINHAFTLFENDGYAKDINTFKELVLPEKTLDEQADEFNVFGFLNQEDPDSYSKNVKNFFNQSEENARVQLQKLLGEGYEITESNILDITKDREDLKRSTGRRGIIGTSNFNVIKIKKGDKEITLNFGINMFKEGMRDTLYQEESEKLFNFVNETMTKGEKLMSKDRQKETIRTYNKLTQEGGALHISDTEVNSINTQFDDPDLFKLVEEEMFNMFGGRTGVKTTQPYKEELTIAKQQLINSGNNNPSKEEIENRARYNLKQQETQKIYDQKAVDYFNSDEVEETDLDAILKLGANLKNKITFDQKKVLAEKETKLTNYVNNFETRLLDENDDLYKAQSFLNIVSAIEPTYFNISDNEETVILKNGTVMSKYMYNDYMSSLETYKSEYEKIENTSKQVNDLISTISDDAVKEDLVRRNYNDIQKFFMTVVGGSFDIAKKGAYGMRKLSEGVFGVDNSQVDDDFLKWQDASSILTRVQTDFQKSIEFDNAFSSVDNFGRFVSQEIANQIPIFAAIGTGTAGIGLLGVSGSGEQWSSMVRDERFYGDEKSLLNKFFKSAGYGAAEIIFDRYLTLPVMKRSGQAMFGSNIRDVIQGGATKYFKQFGKRQLIYDPLLETASEGLTTLTQNIVSGRPILENMGHALFSGGMFGTAFGHVPFYKGMIMSKLGDFNSYDSYRKNAVSLRNLQITKKKLQTSLKANTTKGNDTSAIQSNMETVNQEINRLETENDGILKTIEKKASNLSKRWYEEYSFATNQQELIRADVENIMKDESLTEDQKNELIDVKRNEFNEYQQTRDILRDDKNFGNAYSALRNSKRKKNKQRVQELLGKSTTELINEGNTKPTDDQIDDRAREIFNKQEINNEWNRTKKSTLKLFPDFQHVQTVKQAEDYINSLSDELLPPKDKQNIIDEFNNGAHGTNIVVNIDGKLNIIPVQIVENMSKDDRLETKTHEGGHAFFAATFGNNVQEFEGMAEAVLEFVEKRDKNLYLKLINTIERNADGSLKTEEVLTNFLELAAEGKFNNKSKGLSFLSNMFNIKIRELNEDVDLNFKGEDDAVNFLITLGKKLKAGTLTLGDIERVRGQVKGVKPKQADPSYVFSEAKAKENLGKLQDAPTYNPNSQVLANELPGMVMAQINNYFAARPSLKIDPEGKRELQAEIIARLYTPSRTGRSDVSGFDGRGTLYGYLNGRIKYRMLDAFKDNPTIVPDLTKKQIDEELNRLNKELDDTTDLDNALLDQAVTKVNVLQIGKIASKRDGIVNVVNEKGTFREVIDNNEGKVGSIIFGIPENKIANRNDNITVEDTFVDNEGNELTKAQLDAGQTGIPVRSEAKKIQDFFKPINTAKSFIQILPETNVSEKDADINKLGENYEVSRDALGRAIGLPNLILEYFYNKKFKPNGKRARSQGKSSQVALWELKPEFTNLTDKQLTKVAEQFQSDLSIGEQAIPRSGKVKSGQFVKGAAVVISQQASLSAAQRIKEGQTKKAEEVGDKSKVKKLKQETADITAAQSKTAFSTRPKTEGILISNISPNFEGDVRNVNSLLKDFIKKGKYKFDSEASVNQFYKDVENVLIPSLPPNFITKRFIRPSSRVLGVNRNKKIVVNGKKITIDDYYKRKMNDMFGPKKGDGYATDEQRIKKGLKPLKPGKPFTGKAANFKPQRYGDVFGNSAKEFEKANRDGKIKEFNEVNASMHRQLWQRINKSIKDNRENARIWGSYFSTVSLITEHPHRLGAEFVGWSPKPKGYTDPKSGKFKLYEWEHAMPASQSYLYLLESILDPNFTFETSYELVMDNYKLVALDNFVDKTSIKNAGRTTSMGPNWSIITDSWLDRYFKGNIDIDPTTIVGLNGENFSQIYGIPALKTDFSKNTTIGKATFKARTISYSKQAKGITVLDFDDTLATTKSLVKYTAPDGTTGTLNAEQFASTYQDLQDQGYTFDFSDFNKVVKGKLAPLFNKALKLQKKFGPENMFVLTARPPAAQQAIFDFLKANGLNIPLKNITGLGNSTSEAKALWMADKVAEGYNDFYFADDALQNVQAVKNMLDQFDVKSKIQQAKINFSKNADKEFNDILQDVTGIDSKKRYSEAKARKRGKGKGRFRFFIPPSHEDFAGLLYNFMGKGEKGNKHREFFETNLLKPLNRAYQELTAAKQAIANDYKNLVKQMPSIKDKLTKKTPDGDYYYEDAVRVYLWNKNGFDVPGMSKTDIKELTDLVDADPKLKSFADTIGLISRLDEGYVEPGENWEAGSIKQDLADATGRVGRGKFFAEFIENADIIFSQENLNKIEAGYGLNFREALEDMLARVKTGNNRRTSKNKMVNGFLDYLNGSIGATMFFNARSAVLQTLSTVNFINFGDNNIFKAAARFADQGQFWKDFSMIFNSDVLKQRRAGGEFRLDANEIATRVGKSNTATGKVRAATNYLLGLGFLPTQIADSFAIALGGASYYRNRVNTYLKQGLSQTEAEAKAFTDFQDISEETQQSARPDRLSQQQASVLGRLILAFQNTPSQYARLIKKSSLDLINRRKTPPYDSQVRSDMSNVSRIIYYAAVQNIIFSALQNALFAMMFSEDDEEDEKTKKFFDTKKDRIINGTIDTLLRGSGVGGAIISVLKNAVIKYGQQQEKGWGKKLGVISDEVMQLSPPIGIKLRKLDSFERTMEFNKKVIPEMDTFDINNPMWRAYAQLVEGATNIPVARLFRKVENINAALDAENQWWQRVAVGLGWSKWDVGIENREVEAVKKQLKEDNKKTKTRGRSRGRKRGRTR